MADSLSMEINPRPQKIPKLEKPREESKKPGPFNRLRPAEPKTDEFMRQYLLFHYDFYRTEGFGIEWDKFDFFFPQCLPCDGTPCIDPDNTNEVTLRAIAKYNQENGTDIVFVEHIEANFAFTSFFEHWITFWAKDMSSLCPEPKIYQAHTKWCAGTFLVPIFRVKPTEEEMAADPIHVDPPFPYIIQCCKPKVVFSFAGPGDDPVPGTPFIFNRNPPREEEDCEFESECSECESDCSE